jgi:hypothetical protein
MDTVPVLGFAAVKEGSPIASLKPFSGSSAFETDGSVNRKESDHC